MRSSTLPRALRASVRRTLAAAACAFTIAACADAPSPTAVAVRAGTPDLGFINNNPTSPYSSPRTPDAEFLEVCKDYQDVAGNATTGPDATFSVNDGTSTNSVTIASGQCRDVYIEGGAGKVVTVTETVPTGYAVSWTKVEMTGDNATRVLLPSTSGTTASVTGQMSGRFTTPGYVTGTLIVFTNRELPASIGDRVWRDDNGDGVQDSGEPGLTGWNATITGANLPTGYPATQATGSNGSYLFGNLPAGTYQVCIAPASGYAQTYDLDGLATPNCASRTVVRGENATDVDFGYEPPLGKIGNFVWNDLNTNGIQDAGEAGISGVVVTLGGAASATTSTNASGYYEFNGLAAGSYTVTVATPSGMTASPSTQGSDLSIDSNVSGGAVVLATNASQDLTIDFGFYTPRPPVSCTLTQGYWKTHQEKWDSQGERVVWNGQTFFNSGKSFAEIYAMSAAGGNSYIQLAHQYIAAKLNVNGGSDPVIDAAIAQAESLLGGHTAGSSYIKNATWTALAGTLASYNEGRTGPGHCD